jgi:hypothetical protein
MSSRAARRLWFLLATVVVIVLAVTLAVRLYATRHLERALARFEAAGGHLDLADYAPPPIEDRTQNAALWLRAGADALIVDDEQKELVARRVRLLGEPWPAADVSALEALLADHQPALRLIERAAGLDRSSFEIEYLRGAQADLPDFISLLRAGTLLAVASDYRLQRGDVDQARSTLHLLERLTAAQHAESVLIAHLVGAAVERLYHERLEAMLQVADLDALRAMRRDLEHLGASSVSPGRPFLAETGLVVPYMLGATRMPPGLPVPESSDDGLRLPWLLRAVGLDREVAALLLETGLRVAESVEEPLARVGPDDYLRSVMARSRLPLATRLARPLTLAPNLLDAIRREQWVRSARALARLALDLRLSRLGHGAYPPPSIELPVSAATGERAVYRMLDDGSVEIAFPEAEAIWTEEQRNADLSGKIHVADVNLRWRLPP